MRLVRCQVRRSVHVHTCRLKIKRWSLTRSYTRRQTRGQAGRSRSRRCGLRPNPARSAQAPPPLPNEEIWPGAAQATGVVVGLARHARSAHPTCASYQHYLEQKKKKNKDGKGATCQVQAFRFQCAPRKPVLSNAARPIKKKRDENRAKTTGAMRERPQAGGQVQGFNALHGLELQLVETRTRQRVDASRGPELVTLATGMI